MTNVEGKKGTNINFIHIKRGNLSRTKKRELEFKTNSKKGTTNGQWKRGIITKLKPTEGIRGNTNKKEVEYKSKKILTEEREK